VADLPPELSAAVAQRSEKGVLLQLGGCGGCILFAALILGLLVYAITAADRDTQRDPESAAASLQQIVPSTIPEGYRGFRGIARAGRRIVLVVPHTHSGLKVPLTGRLTLSVWTFEGPKADLAEVQTYWESKLLEDWLVEKVSPVAESTTTLEVRGEPCQAKVLTYEGGPRGKGKTKIRLLIASFPRVPGQPEEIAVGAIGGEERFDRATLDTFLKLEAPK
jgi:hypothetical protein